MTIVEIITLIIGIITIMLTTFFMCNLEDSKKLTSSKAQSFLTYTFILSIFLGLFISISLYERELHTTPTALDVYRDKTILNINITYQDGNIIECDSTVIFKSDSVKLAK